MSNGMRSCAQGARENNQLVTPLEKSNKWTPFIAASLLTVLFLSASANARDFEPRYWYQLNVASTLYSSPQAAFEAYKAWEENNNLVRPDAHKITVLSYVARVPPNSYWYNGRTSTYSFLFTRPEDCPQGCTANAIHMVTECPADTQTRVNILVPGQSLEYYCAKPAQQPDPSPCEKTPKPILLTTGAKETIETDFIGNGAFPLRFVRTYRSDRGGKWSHNHEFYGFNLAATINTDSTSAVPERACVQGVGVTTGETYCFKYFKSGQPNDFGVLRDNDRLLSFGTTSDLSPAADINDRVKPITDGVGATIAWQAHNAADDSIERYDLTGRVQTVTSINGLVHTYTYSDGTSGPNGGFILDETGNPTPDPLPLGLLTQVTDASTRSLKFGYNASKQMVLMVDTAGLRYTYEYGPNNNLTKVNYPDGKSKFYLYGEVAYTSGENLPNSLTGIIDENGVRYATYRYDAQGRAYDEDHGANLPGGPVDHYNLVYNVDGSGNPTSTTVTDPLGTQRTHNFTTILGVVKSTGQSQPGGAGCGPASSATTYDANGNVASRADFNGNKTCYAYDLARNLETARVEGLASGTACPANLATYTPAAGTAQRKILTEWHPTFRLPVKVTEAGREITTDYDDRGNITSYSIKDTVLNQTRTWTASYIYHPDVPGVLSQKTEDGPRTDVADLTSTDYYLPDENCLGGFFGCRGQVRQITNALGHVTQITRYTAHGQPEEIVDPNGLVTALTYDARQRLIQRSVGSEFTLYDYDGVGQLKQVTLPNGAIVRYDYDAAHRLTDIWDEESHRIRYTLDAMGNRIQEDVFDANGTPVATRNRVFDALNRLWQEIGAVNAATGIRPTTTYGYDATGNLKTVQPPGQPATNHQYDALNRLFQTTDALGGVSQYSYNPLDQLREVRDPRNVTTVYQVNAFGEQTQVASPDSGTTNKTYDEAGNLMTSIDARGKQSTYSYDALNRLIGISFTSGNPISFGYDMGQGGLGRLTGMTDESGTTQWEYDLHGRVTLKSTTVGGVPRSVAYRYDAQGRLDQLTYPSGKVLGLAWRAGKLDGLSLDGQPVLANVQYHPFAGPRQWSFGNGRVVSRGFDADNRLVSYPLGASTRSLAFDDAGRIIHLSDSNAALNQGIQYDALDRVTAWATQLYNQGYSYDAGSNRTSARYGVANYSHSVAPGSNRLQSVAGPTPKTYQHDAAGNVTHDGRNTFAYNDRGRLAGVSNAQGSTSYLINGLGQRSVKTGSEGIRFVYDEGGKLLGEYDPGGGLLQETVYLGDMPVAVVK